MIGRRLLAGRCSLVPVVGAGGQCRDHTSEQVYQMAAGHRVSGVKSCSVLDLQHMA